MHTRLFPLCDKYDEVRHSHHLINVLFFWQKHLNKHTFSAKIQQQQRWAWIYFDWFPFPAHTVACSCWFKLSTTELDSHMSLWLWNFTYFLPLGWKSLRGGNRAEEQKSSFLWGGRWSRWSRCSRPLRSFRFEFLFHTLPLSQFAYRRVYRYG